MNTRQSSSLLVSKHSLAELQGKTINPDLSGTHFTAENYKLSDHFSRKTLAFLHFLNFMCRDSNLKARLLQENPDFAPLINYIRALCNLSRQNFKANSLFLEIFNTGNFFISENNGQVRFYLSNIGYCEYSDLNYILSSAKSTEQLFYKNHGLNPLNGALCILIVKDFIERILEKNLYKYEQEYQDFSSFLSWLGFTCGRIPLIKFDAEHIRAVSKQHPGRLFPCTIADYAGNIFLFSSADNFSKIIDTYSILLSSFGNEAKNVSYTIGSSIVDLQSLDTLDCADELKKLSSLIQREIDHASQVPVERLLYSADSDRIQIPSLPKIFGSDYKQGLWGAFIDDINLVNQDFYEQLTYNGSLAARDPYYDITEDPVGIDFGTSSTVISYQNGLGQKKLINLDADFSRLSFENPTAIEFSDLKGFLDAWQNEPWRPHTFWSQIKCSYQAKNEMNDRDGAARGIRDIKSWAISSDNELQLIDEKGASFVLKPLPVENETTDIESSLKNHPLDPIEIYAFFIGLFINNQWIEGGRIFKNYYMTFPVKFSRQTRDRILQGFRRGLSRSLPPNLIYSSKVQGQPIIEVSELCSEPTALAACVLPKLGIEPTDAGSAFAVFDFGGGTTDFAFGIYRTANTEEQDEDGTEQIIEIFDAAGDRTLGGEHILELLAYRLIANNVDKINHLTPQVFFECPPFITPFTGSEKIFIKSASSSANTTLLKEALRPIWESGDIDTGYTGQLTLSLSTSDPDSPTIDCTFNIDKDELKTIIEERIRKGIKEFFTALSQAFKAANHSNIEDINVILAGNSCKSAYVKKIFLEEAMLIRDENSTLELNPDENIDDVIAKFNHDSRIKIRTDLIPKQDQNPDDGQVPKSAENDLITLKTCVALGILDVLPGEATGIKMRNFNEGTEGESPFMYNVGLFKKDILEPVIKRNDEYGKWVRVGKVPSHGVLILGYTSDPLAIENKISKSGCPQFRVNFGSQNCGRIIYIRAENPHAIATALGSGDDEIDEQTIKIEELKL